MLTAAVGRCLGREGCMAARGTRRGVETLCRRFLGGDPQSQVPFDALVRPLLVRLARRYAPGLSPDQLEDVAQQALMLLIRGGRRAYDQRRGNATTFLQLNVRR